MRTIFSVALALAALFVSAPSAVHAQASCAAAATLTPAGTCSNPATQPNMQGAANSGLTSTCTGAVTTTYSVWYKFTATSTTSVITVDGLGNNLSTATTYMEVFTGACGTLASVACQNVSTRMVLTTVVGVQYYVRVFVTSNPTGNPANKWNFDICVTIPPNNDNCSGATTLTSSATCSNTSASMDLATATSGLPAGCESAGVHYDVWHKFVATGTVQTVTISTLGAYITNPEIQLYGGTSCAGLTSLACGTMSLTATGLTIGSTYFVRVSNVGTSPTGTLAAGASYNICVSAPTVAKVDYSKSYINVTKGSTGGTVNPGDTLEMRITMVVSAKTVDSLSINDTLFNTKGLRLVPGSIALRTNEGKIYKAFTDVFDTDAGWFYANGLDTVVRINFGTNATQFARGQLSSTSRPSVFNSTCIIMATYRVVVYAPYNTLINFRTGSMTYRDPSLGSLNKVTFTADNLIVYQSPGLCPNAVSAVNALGAEFNGTFGTPSGSPLARNRGTSAYTTYTYFPFTASGGPQDYYYGITNNTSSKFTTLNNWAKPDAGGYRVFQQWDITGDHTGASNTALGNPACDTTKPVSASNPCGYMLVINSAYRTDTAFTYTVNNLCPNTYYELSAWFKNICYKCGCDSTGAGSGAVGYIPSALNDSSGVQPNIAFDVNGVDYFTTGNIPYKGTTPTGSDANNQWVKRGFVYLTGPSETSFTLTLRNNAPGGGGNDWALDDINVTTCLPNMQYSPSLSPTTCISNPITINDTVRSYFPNYGNFQWQRSTDGGTTWSNIAGATGTTSPTWNGSAYQYITSYTIPSSAATLSNNGDRYRVVVATTSSNLTNTNCQVTDGVSIISLQVIDCGQPLNSQLLSFNGKMSGGRSLLNWTTSKEDESLVFDVERSLDGVTFTSIGTVSSHQDFMASSNSYNFVDSLPGSGKVSYRIAMKNNAGKKSLSRIIVLQNEGESFTLTNIVNPFGGRLFFDVTSSTDSKIEISLLNSSGAVVKRQTQMVNAGLSNVSLNSLDDLANGVYILQVKHGVQLFSKKVVKN